MKKKLIQKTITRFKSQFETEPEAVYLSPGRINIIGEHVDYNDGYVLPAAINKFICFAFGPSSNNTITFGAIDLNETFELSPTDPIQPTQTSWANYLLGVLHELKKRGFRMPPFHMAFSSTIPMGSGLSSSAALECGFAYALNKMFDFGLSKKEIALIGQQAEHQFAGVKCGIMDQFASVFGKKNKVIKLDCNSLEYSYFDAHLGDYALLLLDSHVKHTHLTSGYNDRRLETEKGLQIIQKKYPQVKSFRDCTIEQIESLKTELGDTLYKRCHYVVTEIRRVPIAADALSQAQYETLGKTMTETHWGLSHEYEVSCPEIDFLVTEILKEKGVAGARMMGGGFGGCSINLVKKESQNAIIDTISKRYKEAFGIELSAYKIKISKGTSKYSKWHDNLQTT